MALHQLSLPSAIAREKKKGGKGGETGPFTSRMPIHFGKELPGVVWSLTSKGEKKGGRNSAPHFLSPERGEEKKRRAGPHISIA